MSELITLPNGSSCVYIDENHSYWMAKPDGSKGKRLANVSTVVKPLDFGADGLMDWAVKLAYEGVVKLKTFPHDPAELALLCEEQGLDWRSIRNAKATIGSDVHERFLHALARGAAAPDLGDFPEEVRGYGQAVLRWWHDRAPEVLQAEQVVLSAEHGYAGRFDLRAKLLTYPGVSMVDAKTSKWIGAGYHAQLTGYDLAAAECGVGESDHLLILKLLDDGTYEEIPVCADRDDFVNALKTYRASGAIKNAARKNRRQLAEAA